MSLAVLCDFAWRSGEWYILRFFCVQDITFFAPEGDFCARKRCLCDEKCKKLFKMLCEKCAVSAHKK